MPLQPGILPSLVSELSASDVIVVSDGAVISSWTQGLVRVTEFPGFLDHSPLGSMGVGMPLALGAATAAQDIAAATGARPRQVVLITGDGAAGYFISEWGTAAQFGLGLTVLISNDSGWGTERLKQIEMLGRPINTDFSEIRYSAIAEGFGCDGVRPSSRAEFAETLVQALVDPSPTVIDVITDGVGPRPELPRFFPPGRHGPVDN